VQYRDGAVPLFEASRRLYPFIEHAFPDAGCAAERVAKATQVAAEIVRKSASQPGGTGASTAAETALDGHDPAREGRECGAAFAGGAEPDSQAPATRLGPDEARTEGHVPWNRPRICLRTDGTAPWPRPKSRL
jgi:hypothetical protein